MRPFGSPTPVNASRRQAADLVGALLYQIGGLYCWSGASRGLLDEFRQPHSETCCAASKVGAMAADNVGIRKGGSGKIPC